MAKKMMPEGRTEFGVRLEEGLKEALAWKRGETALPVLNVELMPAARVKEIRKRLAKSPKEFERRFGVPARTIEGWEQGRKVDATSRVLLTIIDREPEAVERALIEAAGAARN
jgi:putative transcriptional regulator